MMSIRSPNRRAVRRVRLKNYRSIAECDVRPAQLTFLVGPNGAGKSNFLDALRFVGEALRFSLDHAVQIRGGLQQLRTRSYVGRSRNVTIHLELGLRGPPDDCVLKGRTAEYSFTLAGNKNHPHQVTKEECTITGEAGNREAHFLVAGGSVKKSTPEVRLPASADRLYLVTASHLDEFRPVYDLLTRMVSYNLDPSVMRVPPNLDPSDFLRHDGANIAAVISALPGSMREAVTDYLTAIVPGLVKVVPRVVGRRLSIEFTSERAKGRPWTFLPHSMSDGTLRALGILVALFQEGVNESGRPTVVGIEEPESSVHPGASDVLLDAMVHASKLVQLVVTSHSPDLLDGPAPDGSLFPVVCEDGLTRIGPLSDVALSVIRDRLCTPGELLRMNKLLPRVPTDISS